MLAWREFFLTRTEISRFFLMTRTVNGTGQVRPARQMAVARAAIGVGRVRQARERALEVEKKDAVPLRVDVSLGPFSITRSNPMLRVINWKGNDRVCFTITRIIDTL